VIHGGQLTAHLRQSKFKQLRAHPSVRALTK
jgi:hypothetical protein